MGVVAAEALLLGQEAFERRPRLKVELGDADVVGERSPAKRLDVLEFGIAAEEPLC
jgi:hypothetical protein